MGKKNFLAFKVGIIFAILFAYFVGEVCAQTDNKPLILNLHYERGIKFYKQAQYDKATEEFQRVLEIDPNHPKAKKYLEAVRKKENKGVIYQLYRQASTYYKQRQYKLAQDTYQKILELAPSDGYASYHMEILRAKMEKLERLKEKQGQKESKRLALEKKRKERLQESEKTEEPKPQERQKARGEIEKEMDEIINQSYAKQERSQDINTALEQTEKLAQEKEYIPGSDVSSKQTEQVSSLPKEMSQQERLERAKLTYNTAKLYYRQKDYRRAIEAFQQVVLLEQDSKLHYSPYAKKYLNKTEKILQEQVRQDKIKEIKQLEKEMMDKIREKKPE